MAMSLAAEHVPGFSFENYLRFITFTGNYKQFPLWNAIVLISLHYTLFYEAGEKFLQSKCHQGAGKQGVWCFVLKNPAALVFLEGSQTNKGWNKNLECMGLQLPTATKTGTTIVGLIYKDGVILGADTKATAGSIQSDKNCSKIHYLSDNIYCCGAGVAADTEMTTQMISSQLKLLKLNTGREVYVATANRILKQLLFRYQGHIGAALVLGGVDSTGPHIYCIHPHGSAAKLPYATMGSGSLAAMAVFESKWKPDLTEEEGKKVVSEAIQAGIFNDLGSGGNVDMCIIRKGSVDYIRPFLEPNKKGKRQSSYRFRDGTTPVLTTRTIPIVTEETVKHHSVESMDVSS